MKCALCQDEKQPKSNTHYLTDSVIRSCLNIDGLDGNKNREKGFYFDLSSRNPFVNFNFQRNTPVERLEEVMKRSLYEIEIENAKNVPFSVNDKFCKDCESLFTEIEQNFCENILPLFRNRDLQNTNELFLNSYTVRLFFYIQIWRTTVCSDVYEINPSVAEDLRQIIYNHKKANINEIKKYPLSITYLETLGDSDKEKTGNSVLIIPDKNPYIIFMNDFVIQFFDNENTIQLFEYHGLNNELDYKEFINLNEKDDKFKVRIIHNEDRKKLLCNVILKEKAEPLLNDIIRKFIMAWTGLFSDEPSRIIIDEYLATILEGESILKYTSEDIISRTREFILNKKPPTSA